MISIYQSRSCLRIVAIAAGLLLTLHDATQASALDRLGEELRGSRSATEVLTTRCAALGFASPALIRAVRVSSAQHTVNTSVRALLRVRAGEAVHFRRVRLMCGSHVLLQADNWYVPDRLTAAMNHTLETTETSFGTVVKPLGFHREILKIGSSGEADYPLVVKAILLSGKGERFSLVIEHYARVLLKDSSP